MGGRHAPIKVPAAEEVEEGDFGEQHGRGRGEGRTEGEGRGRGRYFGRRGNPQ